MRKQTIGLAGALMLCGISMLTGCGARGLEQAYSFQEREAQMTPAAGAGLAPFFASSLCVPESADGDIAPDDAVTAQAGALFDVTDSSVIYGKNIYDQMYPASITKVMTAIIAIEEGNLSDAVTANDDVVIHEAGASMAGIKPGDTFTLEQLLYGLMIPSGNDAANAVASAVSGGDIPAFCDKMNAEAQRLGATQTHFVTPNGLDDPDHYTTAYDLYLIFNECLKYDLFKDAIHQAHYTAVFTRDGQEVQQTYDSTNYYLLGNKTPPEGVSIIGGKTGTTDNAGLCLILYVEDGSGNGYISVLLGCPDKDTLYSSMSKLLSDISK